MNKIRIILSVICGILTIGLNAQDVTTVEAKSSDISDNLDLEAVASVFGESKDLEDFEKRLNDPEAQISNLDLNEDGEVDYLRVIDTSDGETHLVTIQAVIGKDQYQDVATIDVEKDDKGETHVQVVGDVYMYGSNYIIEPVYVAPPVVVVWFWGPYYSPWYSPYYWGYYPPYYHPWHPYPPHMYRTRVHVHISVRHTYRHTHVRRSTTAASLQSQVRRNDHGVKNPDRSFEKRNSGATNREQLNNKKPANDKAPANNQERPKSTGRDVQDDWKPASEREGKKSNVKDNKVTVPSNPSTRPSQGGGDKAKPNTRPSQPNPNTRPAQPNPSTRPTPSPSTRPNNNVRPSTPNTRPAAPAARPAPRPQSRPAPRR